jgi:predicted RND superfamily exporter protein
LQAIADLCQFLEDQPEVAGVTSIAGHVKRMHQAMNDGDPAFYRVPEDEETIGTYLFLYEMAAGPNGLTAFVDADYRQTMIRALSKTDTASFSRDLLRRLEEFRDEHFAGLPVTVGIAGGTLGIQTALNDVVVAEKVRNMFQVSLIIFFLCSLLLRSFVGGLFVLVPLLVAVALNFGLMGWSETWLDMATATITAMGISIGADFAIYLIFRIREELAVGDEPEEAIRRSLRTSGKAIFFVSSAVALGYMVLPLSGFSIWIRLGLLTSVIVAASAVAALILIPALALLFRPRFLFG